MGEKCMTQCGITLLIVGVFLWLNDSYNWFNWPQFIAILIVVKGLIVLFAKGMCGPSGCGPASKPAKRKRR